MKQWQRYLLFLILLTLPAMACSFVTDGLDSGDPSITEPRTSSSAGQKDLADKEDVSKLGELAPMEEALPGKETAPPRDSQEGKTPARGEGPVHEWPASIVPLVPFERTVASEDENATFELLASSPIPERDDIELARLYKGWEGTLPAIVPVSAPLEVGTVQQLYVLNHDDITLETVPAELLVVSEHAYFWFDTGPGSFRPSPGDVARAGEEFDTVYEQSVALFGPENNPGVDGDPRVHILNASPGALCESEQQCRVAGYYSGSDGLPTEVDPKSNAREMFVMNVNYFGQDYYINILAHELRHMIEDNYDRGDADWEAEGAAMLAEDLLGFQEEAISRGNLFLTEPDLQLNNWTDGYTIPNYGQGYLLNRYIYDQLGRELYGQFAESPAYGLQAIDVVAQANDLDLTGEDLWLDWLAAIAVHDRPQVLEKYQFGITGLDNPAMVDVDRFPATFEETVKQYAVDYYHLEGNDEINLNFNGSALTTLLDTVPASGQWMWAANRANYSHASLTRPVDLTGVDKATLHYQVYHDIEAGYDFAYLFVSENGGQSWQPLVAPNMGGPEEDPSESALASHFYTGQSQQWLAEQVDLTPYAGQEIFIRFAYVTDSILTMSGMAVDNIAIPEIGFFDDVETMNSDWTGLGFERVTAAIPQQWHLQLITFPDGIPQVESLSLSSEQTLSHLLDLSTSDGEAILIVAASAPMTLEPAYYRLGFSE